MTPGKAVRLYCLECRETFADVRDCECSAKSPFPCPFHGNRMRTGRVSVKTIRKFCLWCMGNSSTLVGDCKSEKCPLWEYRMGKNPKRTGKGGCQFSRKGRASRGFSAQEPRSPVEAY